MDRKSGENNLRFPFRAKCIAAKTTSPLRNGETAGMRAERIIKIALIVIVPVVLGVYFASKVTRFQHQGYMSDLFSHLEIARGWLQGRPLLHENRYGFHGTLHNYFLDLVVGPFTLLWGVYGLFLVQILLYALSF